MSAQIKMQIQMKEAELKDIHESRKPYAEHYGKLATQAEQKIYDLKTRLQRAETELTEIIVAHKPYNEHYGYQAAQAEQEIYELNIKLQLAEADEAFVAEDKKLPEGTKLPEATKLPEGTKLKWVLNDRNYRVAIVTKKGVLEVKDVACGAAYYHDWESCTCVPCSEIKVSGGTLPPWLRSAPLAKTLFATEEAWRKSLPNEGEVTVTLPIPGSSEFNKLCLSPLTATTDPLKLKELEERFPEAKFVLTTHKEILEINYIYYDVATYPEEWNHQIYCKATNTSFMRFKDFGRKSEDKPYLIAEWRGIKINLSRFLS